MPAALADGAGDRRGLVLLRPTRRLHAAVQRQVEATASPTPAWKNGPEAMTLRTVHRFQAPETR